MKEPKRPSNCMFYLEKCRICLAASRQDYASAAVPQLLQPEKAVGTLPSGMKFSAGF